jgi:hypothetical protein
MDHDKPRKTESKVLLCRICGKPVRLESAKADGEGKAVHEECYVRKVSLR